MTRPVIIAVVAACAGAPRAMPIPIRTGHVTDFDFLVGAWSIDNRKLNADGTWTSFASSSCFRRELDGVVNVDVHDFPSRGYSAMALRIFDLASRQWSIYWIESRAGILLPPVRGGFDGARGEFYGDDVIDGTPAVFRFIWTVADADHAHWEQAYTTDGGTTWTTNWTMAFTRTSACGA